jgi:ribonuclease HII
MHKAIEALSTRPEVLLIDGNRFAPYFGIPHQCIVKGDSKYAAIAAASILAKTHRDERMHDLHQLHPEYGWKENKGYPTPKHKALVRALGYTPFHRISFKIRDWALSPSGYYSKEPCSLEHCFSKFLFNMLIY